MNYHQYYPVDIVNGPGTRCTLFVSGCVHECPGCYNKSTWRVNSGMPFTAEMADRIIADLNDMVVAQWRKIDSLERRVGELRDEFDAAALSRADGREPPPPHY